jgi:E3 ubiquitin-protein ligase SHPRH
VAAFINYVQTLAEEDTSVETSSNSEEPPSKRVRLSTCPSSVTVARYELAFTSKSSSPSVGVKHIQRQDVGRYLRFQRSRDELSIRPLVKPKTGHFNTFLLIDTADLSDAGALTALETLESQSYDPEIEGCIWARVGIDITQQHYQVDVKLTVAINWSESQSVFSSSKLHGRQKTLRDRVRAICLPREDSIPTGTLSPPSLQTFYEALCVPETDLPTSKIPGLSAQLYPFQRRSVQWLLSREGVRWWQREVSGEPSLDRYDADPSNAPISFQQAADADGKPFAISQLFDVVTTDPSPSLRYQHIKGGILAEEMGLGKTLEIISLILLHRRPERSDIVHDPYLGRQLRVGKATLIVTPPSLLDQWLSEVRRHAPELTVMHYRGLPPMASGKRDEKATISEFIRHDVVVTTYDVLRAELHAAMDPPARSMRRGPEHDRARSPLVEVSWWRVCIDEAQMVESRQSNVAVMARLIPRINAWAITGTPVKDNLQDDLRGLLAFLRYEPYASDNDVWKRLFSREQKFFGEIVHLIGLRHTKSQVRSEIELPPQKRYVITMPFSAVEEQNYSNLFEILAHTCGLDAEGSPLGNDWSPEDPAVQQAMRVALDQLRQAVLQPGAGGARRVGRKEGPLRTLADVLDAMLEQSDSKVRTLQRSLFSLLLTRGQVLANLGKTRDALAVWQDVLKKNEEVVVECRKQLQQELELARESAKHGADVAGSSPFDDDDDDDDDTDDEDLVSPRLSEARRRLRHSLEIQHKAVFFCANAYFSIKSDAEQTPPESEEFQRLDKLETESYDSAKSIRKEILHESQGKAKKLMDKLAGDASTQNFATIPELKSIDQKGIESRRIVEAFEHLCGFLDEEANVLDEWREHVIQLLLKSLVDEETDEITGEEYEQSTKLSEEILVYVQALKTVLADRHQILTGQPNGLVEHEYKVAARLAKDGEGPCPEKLLKLFQVREALKPDFDEADELSSLRGIIAALRNLSTKLQQGAASGSNRSAAELAIVTQQLQLVQRQLTDQSKAITAMEKEADLFTNTMNARIEFYRQLQAVSDMVADYEGDKSDQGLQTVITQEDVARNGLLVAQGRHRYLVHLKDAESNSEEARLCVICRETFEIGVLTTCGHQFCKTCISQWLAAHHNCPTCKERLQRNSLHDITFKPQELKVHFEDSNTGVKQPQSTSPNKKTGIYSEFNPEQLAQIKNIDLEGPTYTTKVANLLRHILWLREHDPGAKAIVFSQYKDFLDVVGSAFENYRIGYTSFDKARGITSFREDPGVEVFLLHARAHSSGLNLINASHVFLCEPLLNTALELQAIARVDRIGQQHETTVWLYVVEGTVEESIYNLSVQRRMEHMGRSGKGKSKESTPELLDASLEVANSLEMQQASLSRLMGKGRISGEVVGKEDLWQCLFGAKTVATHGTSGRNEWMQADPRLAPFMAGAAAEERRASAQVTGADGSANGHG